LVELSLLVECRERVERALARLNLISSRDPRQEIRLHAALGISLNYTTGAVSETAAAWSNTLIIARRLGDAEYQLRALRGLWAHYMNAGDYRRSLAFARDFCSLAATSDDPASLDLGNRMAALICIIWETRRPRVLTSSTVSLAISLRFAIRRLPVFSSTEM
jgi:hypothetical protein